MKAFAGACLALGDRLSQVTRHSVPTDRAGPIADRYLHMAYDLLWHFQSNAAL
jgi:hypothetical protein